MNKTSASLEWMKILGLDKCQLATWVNNFLCFSLILVLVFPCTTTYVDHLFRIWKKNNLTRWKFMLDQTTYERKKEEKKIRWKADGREEKTELNERTYYLFCISFQSFLLVYNLRHPFSATRFVFWHWFLDYIQSIGFFHIDRMLNTYTK